MGIKAKDLVCPKTVQLNRPKASVHSGRKFTVVYGQILQFKIILKLWNLQTLQAKILNNIANYFKMTRKIVIKGPKVIKMEK